MTRNTKQATKRRSRGRKGGKRSNDRSGNDASIATFFDKLSQKADVSDLLHEHLKGVMLFKIDNLDNDYVVDFREKQPVVKKIEEDHDEEEEVDCILEIDGEDFKDILNGKLNPQIAMLSHKIHVEGSMDKALYFFNVLQ